MEELRKEIINEIDELRALVSPDALNDIAYDVTIANRVLSYSEPIGEANFRIWLSKQNKKGGQRISIEHQNACYYALKAIPSMIGFDDVFSIIDPDAFRKYRQNIERTKQYQEANPNVGAGVLSAALTQYGKYLEERHMINISIDRLAQILKDWYDNKYVENNITSTLVGFGFKYARAMNNAKITSKSLLSLANIQDNVDDYIDRGKDLAASIEKDSIGIKILPMKSFAKGLICKTSLKTPYDLNRILFGAPGTGKSHTLNKDIQKLVEFQNATFERVTFHPEYSYASFVGCYKPVSENGTIEYKYVAGPFMRVLVEAYKSGRTASPRPHILLIEELNRARVAAVFGEVFQLLDRDADGVSEYAITPSDDIKKYLVEELGGSVSDYNKIQIPNNMFIWATMNSADQGVFPMDTAFKRRWNFKYIGIDDNDTGVQSIIKIGDFVYDWNKLRKAINAKMSDLRINEDKLLGPYFISKHFFNIDESNSDANNTFVDVFMNKVLMYLFEDACKQKAKDMFESCDYSRYSRICEAFKKNGIEIFGKAFESDYYNKEC